MPVFLGISMITTNYSIIDNLPTGKKITEDFRFFEEQLTGFRPMELAVYAQGGYKVDDYAVVKEINKVEERMRQIPSVKAVGSVASLYKSVNQMYGNNRPDAFRFPDDERRFEEYRRILARMPQSNLNVLVNEDRTKARITSRIF